MKASHIFAMVAMVGALLLGRQADVVASPIINPATCHEYYVLSPTSSWQAAENAAVALGGHLATINDTVEYQWIKDNITPLAGEGAPVWIGLNDLASENQFVWVSGEATPAWGAALTPVPGFGYPWRNSGEPQDGTAANCVYFGLSTLIGVGGWVDYYCTGGDALFGLVEVPTTCPDSDGDGVTDASDACPGTTIGAPVDADGCSGEQLVDLDCPCSGGWKNHYQRPGNPGSEEFRAFVAATCRERDIKVIAEEMSLDGLFGAKQSVCNQVADSLRLTHRYCDPSIEEQKTLGIAHPGKTNPSAFSAVPDPHEVDPEVEAANEIRRRCWLQRIVGLDSWPVLFVCGAHHVKPFHAWLRAHSIVVHVLCPRWTPK